MRSIKEMNKRLDEREQEIERLNELVKGLREERDYLFNKTTTESNYEIERLNKELEEKEAIYKEQRDLIKRLLREMDSADEVIKQQYFEIERLNNIINESNKMIDKIVEEVYKPVDKEWDNILCIIEDYKLKLQELKGSNSNENL